MRLLFPPRAQRLVQRALLLTALLSTGAAPAAPLERELELSVEVEAQQTWDRKDEQYGHQWSKATSRQQYRLKTQLRSDGRLYARNLLDPDVDARLEAKTLHLARQALTELKQSGVSLQDLSSEAGKARLMRQMQEQQFACRADMSCRSRVSQQFAAIFAAFEHPDALADEQEPGRYRYFLPFPGCRAQSRVKLVIHIEGLRYNKTWDKHEPFTEHREADVQQSTDGVSLCDHYTAVLDEGDPEKRLYLENVYVPAPMGETVYTERGHTTRRKEPQPLPSAVLDWVTDTLRHAPESGSASAELPLVLPLNGNATVLGLFTGTAKVRMQWRFGPPAASTKAP